MKRNIKDKILKKLSLREEQNSLRSLKIKNDLIDFCSNDYLGFAKTPSVNKLAHHGATGSRLISGNSSQFEILEQKIAKLHHAEAGLIFNSGYDANIGLFSCIADKGDTIIYDQYIHASIRDGIRLSNARSFSFEHNDVSSLEKKLQRAEGHVLVAIESIYSMDGDEAPLKKIIELCEKFEASVILDEAHATGVVGKHGLGLAQTLGVESRIFARIHTFGKALGSHGAIILGSNEFRTYLINFARSFIYTTALSEHNLNTIECAYERLIDADEVINKLHHNIRLFQSLLSKKLKAKLIPSSSPIQCILVPGNENVRRVETELQNKRLDIRAILHPTVQQEAERIRICIHSFNTEEEIKTCVKCLEKLIP
jgi:8-amino-7-oxononanoate synthase